MIRLRENSRNSRWAGGLLAGAAMVAAVSVLINSIESNIAPVYLLSLYLLVILPAAILGGTGLGAAISVLSVGAYGYFFAPPQRSFELSDWRLLVAFGVFVVTAVVVGELAGRLRRAALASALLSEEQAALRRVATLVAQSPTPAAVFDSVTREVGLLCGADLARLERYEPDGTVTAVAAWSRVKAYPAVGRRFDLDGPSVARDVRVTGGPVRIDSFTNATGAIAREVHEMGVRSSVGCPILASGRIWGVIAASTTKDELFPAETEAQIANFTELVATAIENAEAREELRLSRARVVATADETRRRIERDLHDGAQQRLVSLALQLRSMRAGVPASMGQLAAELDRVMADLNEALDELREMARGIHPAILAEGGLVRALKALARRSPLPVEFVELPDGHFPEQVEVSTYYVVSEALTNAAKHADASTVAVSIERHDSVLQVIIRDDGVGGAEFARGTGLTGLKDRVQALGGRIELDSPRGAGTTLHVELPLVGGRTAHGTRQR